MKFFSRFYESHTSLTHTRTHMHTHTHTHTHSLPNSLTLTHTLPHSSIHTHSHTHACTHTPTCMHAHTLPQACMQTGMLTRMHAVLACLFVPPQENLKVGNRNSAGHFSTQSLDDKLHFESDT